MKTQDVRIYTAQRLHWLAELPALWPDISVTSSISSNIELNSLEANKGAALKQLCGLLGVGIEETLAFGDGPRTRSRPWRTS